jgi:DNA polymerase-4
MRPRRLREAAKLWETMDKKGMRGRTVTVKLRTPDFKTATRRLTPPDLPSSASDLAAIGITLLDRFPFPPEARFRLAGLGLSNFLDEDDEETEAEPALFATAE